jgi:hypothetical protein
MKKVLLLSLFGVFAYANNPVKEETKEIKRAGTSVCQTASVSGSNQNGPIQFTTICCTTLAEGHSVADYVGAMVNSQQCADDKRDAILQILND